MVDVTGTEGLLETVLVAFLWCPSVAVVSGTFTIINGNLGQAMIFLPGNVPCPAYPCLQ